VIDFLSNWKEILRRAWSIRFAIIASMLSMVEALFLFLERTVLNYPPGLFAGIGALFSVLSIAARLLNQKKISPKILK